jgi:hypothetical protein
MYMFSNPFLSMIPTADDDGAATDCDITGTHEIVYRTLLYSVLCNIPALHFFNRASLLLFVVSFCVAQIS